MAGQNARSYGPLAVAFMALHDRTFFANLLGNPEETLNNAVNAGTLTLTREEIAKVVKAVTEAREVHTPAEVLTMWDHWNTTGRISTGDWLRAKPDWIKGIIDW